MQVEEVIDISIFSCNKCLDGMLCGCLMQDAKVTNLIRVIVNNISNFGCIEICNYEQKFLIEEKSMAVDNAFSEIKSFFMQNIDMKTKALSKDRARRGYSPILTENFGSLLPGKDFERNDMVEKFRIGPLQNPFETEILSDARYLKEAKVHFFPNDWTNVSPAFRSSTEIYYESISNVAAYVMKLLAFCFGLDPLCLLSSVDKHTSILSLNHYPKVATTSERRSLWMAEHTDISMISLIAQCPEWYDSSGSLSSGGLQVRTLGEEGVEEGRDSERWISLPRHAGSLVVLVGDYLCDLSNQRLPAAKHRVSIPREAAVNRYSMVFFFSPNMDAPMALSTGGDVDVKGRADEVSTYSQWRKIRVRKAIEEAKKYSSKIR